jgi:exopolysaccharide biosynthesis protein
MGFKMKYEITPIYLTKPSKRRSGIKMEKVKFITAHDTGNENSTAKGNVTYYERSKNEMSASAHIFVDDKQIIECIPFLTAPPEKAWHVIYNAEKDNQMFGDDANDTSGGIEYCFGDNINADEAYKRFVWVHAYACYKFNINPSTHIVGHHILDPKRKIDPQNGLSQSGRNYEQFLKDVVKEYNECIGGDIMSKKYNPTITKERVYAENGKLDRCDGDYSKSATDVRWLKIDANKVKVKLVHEEGKKVSELVKKHNADLGFNFPFFWSGGMIGDIQDQDNIITLAKDPKLLKRHEFAYANGKFVIGQLNRDDKQDFLVQGNPLLIENSKLVYEFYKKHDETAPDIADSKAQRTFVGTDKDGNLILAVGDGRTKWDRGLTLEEMSLFMQSKGATMAINGDGGGSSILVTKDGAVSQNKSNERIVHHAILVYFLDEKETPKITEAPKTVVSKLTVEEEKKLRWEVQIGQRAVKELSEKGLLNNPETWSNPDELMGNTPNWLFFEMIRRLSERTDKK